jgi:tRNA threonylcarbamoyladenosine biosynthesis protein TsaE
VESWTFVSPDPDETHAIGRELGRAIGADGIAIALIGPLGAGKTVFVKGLAEGLGVDPRAVSSPTFVIAQQYGLPEGPDVLHHIDLYRLKSEDELESIGFYDMLAPGSVLAVEWADRFPGVLGREYLQIEFEGPSAAEAAGAGLGSASPGGRESVVSAAGKRAEAIAKDWFERVERRQSARPGTGAFIEMRALWMLVVACGLMLSALADVRPEVDSDCVRLAATREDAIGTLSARCVDAADEARVGLTGVGRLVDGRRIDLNRASVRLLAALPGIGPARATAIREAGKTRSFDSTKDLEAIRGIGPATRARLEGFVEVSASVVGLDQADHSDHSDHHNHEGRDGGDE